MKINIYTLAVLVVSLIHSGNHVALAKPGNGNKNNGNKNNGNKNNGGGSSSGTHPALENNNNNGNGNMYGVYKQIGGPVSPTLEPTTRKPTEKPSPNPTPEPSITPTDKPTPQPVPEPSSKPSIMPTDGPTPQPTPEPSSEPSIMPTDKPTPEPTPEPSSEPSIMPTDKPTPQPTPEPSSEPSIMPTDKPTPQPTPEPSSEPSIMPTDKPTPEPTPEPSSEPSIMPTDKPTPEPTPEPSSEPSIMPTDKPTPQPTPEPSSEPSIMPTDKPTPEPTPEPSSKPTPEETPELLVQSCPDDLELPTIVDRSQGNTVLLENTVSNRLCTLVEMSSNYEIKPVGRSYNGFEWEKYSGDFSSLTFTCISNQCTVDLPELDAGSGQEYYLTSFAHSLSPNDVAARFLEKTTFGPTLSDIAAFQSFESNAHYVEDQFSKSLTSHRAYWRNKIGDWHAVTSGSSALYSNPCDTGARYRKYAITRDDYRRYAKLETVGDLVALSIGGNYQHEFSLRTMVVNATVGDSKKELYLIPDGTYEICSRTSQSLGGRTRLRVPIFDFENDDYVRNSDGSYKLSCASYVWFGGIEGNPEVYFNEAPPDAVTIDSGAYTPVLSQVFGGEEILQLTQDLPNCERDNFASYGLGERVVIGVTADASSTNYWIYSTQHDLKANDLSSPLEDGGKAAVVATQNSPNKKLFETMCANAERTFLNEDTCIVSYDACTQGGINDVDIVLTNETFSEIHTVTGAGASGTNTRYVYRIEGLRQEAGSDLPPCTKGERSRWIKVDDCAGVGPSVQVTAQTYDIFEYLLRNAPNTNQYVRDIYMPLAPSIQCDDLDVEEFDFKVLVDGTCWMNTHVDNYNVYDFTPWTSTTNAVNHAGNSASRNPIKEFAEGRNATEQREGMEPFFHLVFPGADNPNEHSMMRWRIRRDIVGPYLGRYGDVIPLNSLPTETRTPEVVQAFAEDSKSSNPLGPYIVCGSPYEIANDHSVDSSIGFRGGFDMRTRYNVSSTDSELQDQLQTTWMEIALKSGDQLRQRVAWALAQILVVSPDSISNKALGEMFMNYYDIFTRHAFGNYFDILKEVTYSPMMGEMLTYVEGRSTGYYWGRSGIIQFADENFAREIMQLFSIGLYRLNNDGTRQVDEDGNFIRAYTNDHITEYAKVYTGFSRKKLRGNIETNSQDGDRRNQIDPMDKIMEYADHLPKLGLEKQYIGDGYPLCSDLPANHFVKAGAKYRFLGGDLTPELLTERWEDPSKNYGSPKRFKLQGSPLADKLCNGAGGSCNYLPLVELDSDLQCIGTECQINDPRVVEVGDGVFYEYVPPPCVQRAFYQSPKLIRSRDWSRTSVNYGRYMCADPTLQAASAICCTQESDDESREGVINFSAEQVTFDEAAQRCAARPAGTSNQLCTDPYVNRDGDCAVNPNGGCDRYWTMYWSSRDCSLKVKINYEGSVAIVHDVEKDHKAMVKEDTPMFFRVDWVSDEETVDEFLDNYENKCAAYGCSTTTDLYCLCDVDVQETPAFDATSIASATVEDVLSTATIGGIPADTSDFGQIGQIKYFPDGPVTASTVFEVTDANGVTHFRKNIKSHVTFGIAGDSLTFRNPVHFISIGTPNLRDAENEMNAALEQYFYHPNTAPFLAIRFAQRFGISNPSPRYVDNIANAFRSGTYTYGEKTFGNNAYGDLEALTAAVLLDREAESVILDADPVHGSLLEPFMKIVRIMRSLEYEANDENPLVRIIRNMQDFIGQEPHKIPTVFSFFKPEYQPPGLVGAAGFTSPESQVLNGPKSINMMNAVISHLKYGLNDCYGGFGNGGSCYIGTDENYGVNTYSPSVSLPTTAEIVDELATLLTSGRLSQDARQLVVSAYDTAATARTAYHGLVSAEQLITASPEFHSNGLTRRTGNPRQTSSGSVPKGGGYKAVINVMLAGGYDSMNMLVPAEECQAVNELGNTTRDMYNEMRGVMAFDWDAGEGDLQIDVTESELPQTCNKFALHEELPYLQQLYNDGDLAFFANTGVIDQNGMDKGNYRKLSVTQLFAHNAMQEEGQAVDSYDEKPGTGVLGRAKDMLAKNGFSVNGISIDNVATATEGVAGASKASSVVGRGGVKRFAERASDETKSPLWFDVTSLAAEINGETKSNMTGIYGDTWSNVFVNGLEESDLLYNALKDASLDSDPWYINGDENHENGIENEHWDKWSTLFKLIETRDARGVDRDLFFTNIGGWDHHSQLKDNLKGRLHGVNHGIELMVKQLKQRGLWDQVTIVFTSDFARTMTPNGSDGSDHAWGGNYFILGGNVKGRRIHGQYPFDLTYETGPLTTDKRGRYIPTTSWDACWNGVIEWLGVTDAADLEYCLPNKDNTVEGIFKIFNRDDLFDAEPLPAGAEELIVRGRGLRGTKKA